jgi:GMP synthase (glutamine-hydrolysing)
MARPTLLLDCYLDEPGAARNFLPSLAGRDVEVVLTRSEEIPEDPTAYGAIVVSGSAASAIHDPPEWVEGLERLVRSAVDRAVPLLGVCFGHQILASALHGREALFTRDRMEIGWVGIELDPHPLHDGLTSITSFATHFDEVHEGLAGLTVTGRSETCPVQALQVDGKPAWSVQFHPEMRRAEAEALIRRRALVVPDHIPDPEALIAAAPECFGDQQIGRLLDNFFRIST